MLKCLLLLMILPTLVLGVIKVNVKGLVCPSCAYGIKKHLIKTKKVETIKLDVHKQLVYIHVLKGKDLSRKCANLCKVVCNVACEAKVLNKTDKFLFFVEE